MRFGCRLAAAILLAGTLSAQVYSPKLLNAGQPDATDLAKFAQAIYQQAGATTERQKAEAIWRFFLTDGRFVKPGFWYHIAGWTYEEPTGEVLDPIKLLNSYGFGLCYHIAPLLQAVFKAGGFSDARCWFLTGHTVTEVFYDGGYHYFDSDMMGYNVPGNGPFQGQPVSSVRDLERDGQNIILGKLIDPGRVRPGSVDTPWYPADVHAHAMGDLLGLFTSTSDNYLYPYERYSPGHRMDFVLRPGEKLIRYFAPEEPGLFYLPYKFDGKEWTEFPQEIAEYHIRTADGPRSQKDDRMWATGRIEYKPKLKRDETVTTVDMSSPYVIIDARFTMNVELQSAEAAVRVETSRDGGRNWTAAGEVKGPHQGGWSAEPALLVRSAHGRLTAVSGSYGYKVRITRTGGAAASVSAVRLISRIQLNPRTLPVVQPGRNTFSYSSAAPLVRTADPVPLSSAEMHDFEVVTQKGQEYLLPAPGKAGEVTYCLQSGDHRTIAGFDAGVRMLDLRNGLAPDKLTAEVRHTDRTGGSGPASIAWSTSPDGRFKELWQNPEELRWLDGKAEARLLLWPEVLRSVSDLPSGTKRIYVRLRSSGPAFDSVRMAVYAKGEPAAGSLDITQVWTERGVRKEHVQRVNAASLSQQFIVDAGADVRNTAVIFSAQ